MAFGGYFNPNYTLLPNQQGQSPQLPPSPQQGPLPLPPQPQKTQPTFGDMFSMPFMSMPFMPYLGSGLSSKPPLATTAPQVPQVPNQPPQVSQVPNQPPQVPTVPTTPAPVNKPSSPSLPYIPNTGVYGQPGQYAAPNPGNNSMGLSPMPTPTSGQGAYDQALAYYNSPEYAAYYNSLAPSTRAHMHAPGNSATGTYLANSAQQNWEAWQGNPWTRPPGG